MRFVFVVGGVISGVGKGIITASIAKILQKRGLSVAPIKIDPYFNVDAGTLNPLEHGEVWVTEDGGEIDQDFGHYERFLNVNVPKKNSITSGQVYLKVIQDERKGRYLGRTVQLIPHITDEIARRILEAAEGHDVGVVEIGGVVGDYENIPFIFAAHKLSMEHRSAFVLVVYMPKPPHIGELKSKPAQHAIRDLRELGVTPNFVVIRAPGALDELRKRKLQNVVNIPSRRLVPVPDVSPVYRVPIILEESGMGDLLAEDLGFRTQRPDWSDWLTIIESPKEPVKVHLVGKYVKVGEYVLPDAYISVIEAIRTAGWHLGLDPQVEIVDSEALEKGKVDLSGALGIVVPGGFGKRGVEGKIEAIREAREQGIPYLGLCFGMQLAVVEFARNVAGLRGAHTTEVDPGTPHPVIDLLPRQRELIRQGKIGATMRLGAYPAVLREGTLVRRLYGREVVYERHRHRFEVNPKYVDVLESAGLVVSGTSPDGELVEFVELGDHSFFVATQAHPEFKSRFEAPHPLFLGFMRAVKGRL